MGNDMNRIVSFPFILVSALAGGALCLAGVAVSRSGGRSARVVAKAPRTGRTHESL